MRSARRDRLTTWRHTVSKYLDNRFLALCVLAILMPIIWSLQALLHIDRDTAIGYAAVIAVSGIGCFIVVKGDRRVG